MKRIIITGASGLVATELTVRLLSETDACLFLLSTNPDKIKHRYINNQERLSYFTIESFAQFVEDNKGCCHFDVCIHTAFSRSSNGNQIAASLDYQQQLLRILKQTDLKIFVNISSQSVYGKLSEPLWTETVPVDPDYLYAMGKYSSEIITRLMLENTGIKWTNIRLCSVCENARFVRIFIRNAIEGKPIHLTAPNQGCSFIDVQDVADALTHFVSLADRIDLEKVYNLGANLVNTIGDIALRVKNIGETKYSLPPIIVTESDSDNHATVGMDSHMFMQAFNWNPKRNMNDMIDEMFGAIMTTML
ncbi:MAG: NAD(P)-dependent oxidoreductase [Mediterranea massiliensis]|nr:NAD(P)-dependent oxidoreductase [Mediterranea massiliensis]